MQCPKTVTLAPKHYFAVFNSGRFPSYTFKEIVKSENRAFLAFYPKYVTINLCSKVKTLPKSR